MTINGVEELSHATGAERRCCDCLLRGFGFLPELRLFDGKLVSDVVLVNIADVGDSLLSNLFGRNEFYIAEPEVRVKAHICRLFAQLHNAIGPGIVTGKDKECFVAGSILGSLK